MSSEPWRFDKHLVVMHCCENDGPLQDIKFDRTVFWVQVHGVPMKYMTIGDHDGGSFIRIQVSIDLTLPLCSGRLVSLNKAKQVWVSFKYKRLPNIYYWCGCLTHDNKDYDLWIESEGTLQIEQREFGSYLRAAPFSVSRKNVINVPRYYTTRKKVNTNTSTDYQPMAKEHTAQSQPSDDSTVSVQKPNGENRFKNHDDQPLMRNTHIGLTPTNVVDPEITPPVNSVINGISKSPMFDEVALNEVDLDRSEGSGKMNKVPYLNSNEPGLIHVNKSHAYHASIRVLKNDGQKRIQST